MTTSEEQAPPGSAIRVRMRTTVTARGTLRRSDNFETSLERVKAEISRLCRRTHAPALEKNECLAVCCEAVSNWWRHNDTGNLVYLLSARARELETPGMLEQAYLYPSALFDTHPEPPEDAAESGMGIVIIRGLLSPLDPETGEPPRDHPNVSFKFSGGRVTVRLVKRW